MTDDVAGFDSEVSRDRRNITIRQIHLSVATAIRTRCAVDLLFNRSAEDPKWSLGVGMRIQAALESQILRLMSCRKPANLCQIREHGLQHTPSDTQGQPWIRLKERIQGSGPTNH